MFHCQHERWRACQALFISKKSGWSFPWSAVLRSRKHSPNIVTERLSPSYTRGPESNATSTLHNGEKFHLPKWFWVSFYWKKTCAWVCCFVFFFRSTPCPHIWKDFIIANVNVFSKQTTHRAKFSGHMSYSRANSAALFFFLGFVWGFYFWGVVVCVWGFSSCNSTFSAYQAGAK